ncbi:dihydrofolate reductase [Polymorphobacter multimanifer]|uniref:NAD(P)-dependent oxidoreductase n=1 Tax=Polymorphobacter multimanifer TaxID=1070431 RepID=UPI0016633457|nr:NAD(P)-dependent oxidoreductase [Polymorphobacter multimanifer]GGI83985.1 dihydrofolate reductase [Polymorphobacter multimanifer]
MRIVHQFAPPMSAMIAGLPGVTEAVAMETLGRDRWDLPSDADVLFVLHSEEKGKGVPVAEVPRPAGWPGSVKLVQIASAGLDDYPEWLFEAPQVATGSGTTAIPIAEFVLGLLLARTKTRDDVTLGRGRGGARGPERDELLGAPLGTLDGRTLGLLGLGQIGQAAARLGLAFGMKVVATRASDAPSPVDGGELVPIETLAARADHLVLVAPISDATRGIVGADFLGRMKAGAHLVNVARGPLVEEAALRAALDAGRIWASLDVTDPEPLPEGHWLIGHPRVRITPHISWSSPDTTRRIIERLVGNLARLAAGQPLVGAVT